MPEPLPATPAPFGPFRPLQPEMLGTLDRQASSKRKQEYLAQFVHHYTNKTRRSKAHATRYRAPYADYRAAPFFHMSLKEMSYAIVPVNASGARIWDLDGNEYIDIMMDFGANMFGHQAPFQQRALQQQLERGYVLTMRSEAAAQAAELICELSGNERAAFVQSGSEAVMTALRLARHATKKSKIVIFENSYHGLGDGVLVRNHMENGQRVARPVVPAIPACMVAEVIVLPYDQPASLEVIRQNRDQLAAILTEPVQSRAPSLQPKAFLQELRKLTAEADIALIFDEIITGFRCAQGGAQELFDVRADLCTYGKVVGSGVPIGVVAGKARFMDAVDGGLWSYGDHSYPRVERTFFGGTHAQNPLAMASAHAVLTHLKQAGGALQRELTHKTSELASRLNELFEARALDMRVHHFASLFRLHSERSNLLETNLLMYHLWDRGVLLSDIGNNFLSTAHTWNDVEQIIQAFAQSVDDMRSGGFLSAEASPQEPAPPAAGRVDARSAQQAAEPSLVRSILAQLERSR